MKPRDQQGVIDILSRLYAEIREIEDAHGMLFGNGDFRPRIDYFHDAIRALTSEHPADRAPGGRLAVERLAYDAGALRYLQAMPLATLNHAPEPAAGGKKIKVKQTLPGKRAAKPDRTVKVRLSELYQQYGVLFCALLKPLADEDCRERVDALHQRADELSATMDAAARGKGLQSLIDSAAHIEDAGIREEVIRLFKQGKIKEALALMKQAKQLTHKDIKAVEEAHTQYGMAQLGLFEEGKEVVKKLAERGMNLAGQFVQNAMQQAGRDASRGR